MCVADRLRLFRSCFNVYLSLFFSLPLHGLVTPAAGEVWYAVSVMCGVMLFGLAVFLFVFGILPYWFKVHKHLSDILSCWALTYVSFFLRSFASFELTPRFSRLSILRVFLPNQFVIWLQVSERGFHLRHSGPGGYL